MAKKIYIGAEKQFTITNLLGACDDVGNRTASEPIFINQSIYKTGAQSWIFIPTADATEVTYTLRQSANTPIKPHLIPSHKYYFSAWLQQLTPSFGQGSFDFYWPVQEPVFLSGAKPNKANEWCLVSAIKERSSFAEGDYECRVDWNDAKANLGMFFDGLTLVDLTAAFGAGNEPDQAWCDANIPFTKTTATVSRGTAHNVKNMFIGVDGKARKVKKAYIGVNGVARLAYTANTTYGEAWTTYDNLFPGVESIAYGNGKFVIVGNNGSAACSSDGITWNGIEITTGTDKWEKVVFAGGKFVAIASGGMIATSVDAITWSTGRLPTNLKAARAIAYGNGMYVIVNGSSTYRGYVGVSTDGLNWTNGDRVSANTSYIWDTLIFTNGKFMAMAGAWSNDSCAVAYSADGTDWALSALSDFATTSLTYGDGTLVATGYMSGSYDYDIMYSRDEGGTWTRIRAESWSASKHRGFSHVIYADDRFIALPYNEYGAYPYYSFDGITWEKTAASSIPSPDCTWTGIACGSGKVVAITYQGYSSITD